MQILSNQFSFKLDRNIFIDKNKHKNIITMF